MPMEVNTIIKAFKELTIEELYTLLKLRNEVFVVEQNCVYLDTDDKDQSSFHLMVFKDNFLAGYSRLVPAGLSYPEVSIGRVVTSAQFRGNGFGKQVMELAIKGCYEKFGKVDIRISAQHHLIKFYGFVGFVAVGDMYMEDGIPHIGMLKRYL